MTARPVDWDLSRNSAAPFLRFPDGRVPAESNRDTTDR